MKVIEEHGYIPHVKGRGQEARLSSNAPPRRGTTLGCRGGAQLVQPVSQAAGAVRKA
jgi:hypothetical protein